MRRSQTIQSTAIVAAEMPAYDYGSLKIGKSPVTLEEFEQLKLAANFTY